jgi:hypothetical protein
LQEIDGGGGGGDGFPHDTKEGQKDHNSNPHSTLHPKPIPQKIFKIKIKL